MILLFKIIISEGLSFNIFQKPRFNKSLDLSRNVSNNYISPNRNIISKERLDVIHEHNMKSNLFMIKKEAETFGRLFLEYGNTILICTLLNVLASKKIPVSVLEIVDYQGHLADKKRQIIHM